MSATGHSAGAAQIAAVTRVIRINQFPEVLTISASAKVTITFTNSISAMGVRQLFLVNTGTNGCYWTISTATNPVTSAEADTNLATAASGGLSSRGYIMANGGSLSLTLTDRIVALYLLGAGGTTDIRGVAGEA